MNPIPNAQTTTINGFWPVAIAIVMTSSTPPAITFR